MRFDVTLTARLKVPNVVRICLLWGGVGGYFYLHRISVLGYCCFKAVYSLSYIVYNDHSIMYNGRFETRID